VQIPEQPAQMVERVEVQEVNGLMLEERLEPELQVHVSVAVRDLVVCIEIAPVQEVQQVVQTEVRDQMEQVMVEHLVQVGLEIQLELVIILM